VRDHDADVQDDDVVRELADDRHVVLDHDHRAAGAAGDLLEVTDQGPRVVGSEAGGRLVEQHQPRRADEDHRELEPAPVGQRQGAGRHVVRAGQVAVLGRQLDVPAGVQPGQPEVVGRRQVHDHARDLEHPAQPEPDPLVDGRGRDLFPEHADLARVRGELAGDDAEERGLAGAVRADEADAAALVDGEVDAAEHLHGAERHADPLDGERRRAGRGAGLRRRLRRGRVVAPPRLRGGRRQPMRGSAQQPPRDAGDTVRSQVDGEHEGAGEPEDVPALPGAAQELLAQGDEDGAQERAGGRLPAPEGEPDQHRGRRAEAEDLRGDQSGGRGVERAGDGRDDRARGERRGAHPVHVDPGLGGALRVAGGGHQPGAEPAAHEQEPGDPDDRHHDDQRAVVGRHDAGARDRHPVRPAGQVGEARRGPLQQQAHAHRQQDQRRVRYAGRQPDPHQRHGDRHRRQQRRGEEHGQRPVVLPAQRHGVGAEAEERGVAQAEQSRPAPREVQAVGEQPVAEPERQRRERERVEPERSGRQQDDDQGPARPWTHSHPGFPVVSGTGPSSRVTSYAPPGLIVTSSMSAWSRWLEVSNLVCDPSGESNVSLPISAFSASPSRLGAFSAAAAKNWMPK
jgi:hypothetical protein